MRPNTQTLGCFNFHIRRAKEQTNQNRDKGIMYVQFRPAPSPQSAQMHTRVHKSAKWPTLKAGHSFSITRYSDEIISFQLGIVAPLCPAKRSQILRSPAGLNRLGSDDVTSHIQIHNNQACGLGDLQFGDVLIGWETGHISNAGPSTIDRFAVFAHAIHGARDDN